MRGAIQKILHRLRGAKPSPTTDDLLAPYRTRATFLFAIAAQVFLLPFAVLHFVQGHLLLGAIILIIVAALVFEVIVIHRNHPPPIPNGVFFVLAVAAIGLGIHIAGIAAAFWCYPCILVLYFASTRRAAISLSLVMVAIVATILYRDVGTAASLRFALTLMLTIIATHIILSVIENLERRLVTQSVTDPLTGALNRRSLDARLGEALERHRRNATLSSLLLIDIDYFKRINDELGHETGDTVLKRVVELVTARARKLDLLFRIGGEEFLLLLPETRQSQAAVLAEQLRLVVAGEPLLPDRAVTVSIGVSELCTGDSLDGWMKRTDDALYAAKRAGRNRVLLADLPSAGWTSAHAFGK